MRIPVSDVRSNIHSSHCSSWGGGVNVYAFVIMITTQLYGSTFCVFRYIFLHNSGFMGIMQVGTTEGIALVHLFRLFYDDFIFVRF